VLEVDAMLVGSRERAEARVEAMEARSAHARARGVLVEEGKGAAKRGAVEGGGTGIGGARGLEAGRGGSAQKPPS
jgi:hypothetical protein